MIVKDWMREAAEEIASHLSFGHGPDSYVTDEQRAAVVKGYREIIAKHCPMKDGEAWMRVPRCETCKHWAQPTIMSGGVCAALSREVMPPSKMIITPRDFGCVRWEAK